MEHTTLILSSFYLFFMVDFLYLILLGNFMVSAFKGGKETQIPSQVLLTDRE